MGVDHSAFACYGAKIDLNDGVDIDTLDTWLAGKKIGLGYMEWGSRSYGGSGGFLVCASKSGITVEAGCAQIPDVDPSVAAGLKEKIAKAIADGAPFTLASDVAWWVGGHVW